MPKIDVNENVFFNLAGQRFLSKDAFEQALTCAKAELDEDSNKSLPETERTLKIELNDTNRPDLWGTAGCARQLRSYHSGIIPEYSFFSTRENKKQAKYKVRVEKSVSAVRPFLTGFVASGKAISDALLKDIIQTQEKLAWNFGRKRRTISMGVYRNSSIKGTIVYKGVDPDSVSFVPLQWETPLTLREILRQHPKGKEYAFIQEHEKIHPLLTDESGAILSYPPIINSADIGAVQVGDSDLLVELTGTDMQAVTLAASIVACDMADNGFTIEPIEISYEFDTPFGRNCVTPFYFQEPVFCSLARIEKFLGEKLSTDECIAALAKMGVRAEGCRGTERGDTTVQDGVNVQPPEYRNDFLHAADVVEDVMIGRSLSSFKSERPHDFTVGRLTPITLFSRRVKELMVGLGYQEMIYNYLGSGKDFIEKMQSSSESLSPESRAPKGKQRIIRISNPMTENYEYVRDSVLPSLLMSEAGSGHAAYPHRIFEIGKIAFLDDADNYRSRTRQYLGFLHAEKDANFNTVSALMQTLFYYLAKNFAVKESADSRFISGRAATVLYKGRAIGVFGELHPQVLENWGLTMPCIAGELDLEAL